MNQKLMAVWRYDQPPFYCAAKIEEIRNDGCCFVEGYHSWYTPVKILPYDQDRIDDLDNLARSYMEGVKALRQQCMEDANQLFFIK